MNYEQELYNAIALLDFFNPEATRATENGTVFKIQGISGKDDFQAVGRVVLDLQEEPLPVEFMDFTLILAKNVDLSLLDEINEKLYEINLLFKAGVFSIEADGTLLFEAYFPVLRDDIETSLKLFIAEFNNVSDFLDGLYPYLLRVIALPNESDLNEYIEAALSLLDSNA